jgi:MFS family permease
MADTRFDLSSSSIGLIVMIGVFISGSLQAPMGILADRVNKKTLAACGGLLAGAAIFTMNFATGFTHLFLANALFGLAGGISFPAVMALGVIQGRRLDAMGSVMGLLTMAHSLGMLIGPIAAGLLLDRASFQAIFVLGTAINIAGTGLFVLCYPMGEDLKEKTGKRK